VLPLLGEGLRAIAMDTPGYGDAARPPAPYTEVAQYATRIPQLLDGLGIERAHLLGHMTGAVFAAEAAVAFPERVDRLVLVEFLDWAAARKQSEEHHVQVPYARPAADGSHLLALWGRYADMLDRVTLDEAQRRFLSVFQAEYGIGTPPDSPSSGGFGVSGQAGAGSDGVDVYGPAGWQAAGPAAIERYATWERVPLIRAPTLVLCGDAGKLRSGADPLGDQARLVEAIPNASAGILHGLDHSAPFLAPAPYAHALLDFFRGVDFFEGGGG
jgi:pimeloyl-ACP methyl ester carboxylesterase